MSTQTSYKDKITIITFTHLWKNAPKISLIDKTLKSIYSNMDIRNCKHIINFDKKDDSKRSREYLKNLNSLKDKYNRNIEITTYNTIYSKRSYIYTRLVKESNTPYIILWEHDFVLERKIDIKKIIEVMDKCDNINFIRFNKRKTAPYGNIDKWMEEDNRYEIPLVKFCGYTGNPHVERKEWFINYCKPLIHRIKVQKRNSIERAMNIDIMDRRNNFGFSKTHEFLGTYIYGSMNEERYVKSLDEYKSKEAWGGKTPSKEWKENNP